jgi:D-alanyl-D-alanine dipeptidase
MPPWSAIPIIECNEPLVAIPPDTFMLTEPHPYVSLGAPYGRLADGQLLTPWRLRAGVLNALLDAQTTLAQRQPGWRFKLFDAWRPRPVQAFMVWREFQLQAARQHLSLGDCHTPDELQARHPALHAALAAQVYTYWSLPSNDPRTPPPHTTGAAIDLTLVDGRGQEVDMGCPIDETTTRAHPLHYASQTTAAARACHAHRQLLAEVMASARFVRHPNEWWHFSLGDPLWAWTQGETDGSARVAYYGRTPDA